MKFNLEQKNIGLDNQKTEGQKTAEAMEQIMSAVMNEAEKLEIKENDRNEKGELLVSPEGAVSNLGKQNELWWKIARTESFKKFFGDWQNDPKGCSKIVDKNGEPLVIFRGIQAIEQPYDFYNKNNYINLENTYGKGIYFTPFPKLALSYAGRTSGGNQEGVVFPAFANAQKPISGVATVLKEAKDILVRVLIPEKLLKRIPKISLIDYDSIFGKSNNIDNMFSRRAEEVYEILLKDPSQVLLIPSAIHKITKPVAEFTKNPHKSVYFFDEYSNEINPGASDFEDVYKLDD